ncbi:MAG: hypothetical protein MZU79_01760 [Anaerotruncus sp.]|nr:hypothetical protein [Anaerotruncus sp.]
MRKPDPGSPGEEHGRIGLSEVESEHSLFHSGESDREGGVSGKALKENRISVCLGHPVVHHVKPVEQHGPLPDLEIHPDTSGRRDEQVGELHGRRAGPVDLS